MTEHSPLPWRFGSGAWGWDRALLDANGHTVLTNSGRGSGDASEEDEAFIIAAVNQAPLVEELVGALERAKVELADWWETGKGREIRDAQKIIDKALRRVRKAKGGSWDAPETHHKAAEGVSEVGA